MRQVTCWHPRPNIAVDIVAIATEELARNRKEVVFYFLARILKNEKRESRRKKSKRHASGVCLLGTRPVILIVSTGHAIGAILMLRRAVMGTSSIIINKQYIKNTYATINSVLLQYLHHHTLNKQTTVRPLASKWRPAPEVDSLIARLLLLLLIEWALPWNTNLFTVEKNKRNKLWARE